MTAAHTVIKSGRKDSEVATGKLHMRLFSINGGRKRVRKQPTVAFRVKGRPPSLGAV